MGTDMTLAQGLDFSSMRSSEAVLMEAGIARGIAEIKWRS